MQLFMELVKLSFQRQFTYRAATAAGLVTNFFFGLLRAAVMLALYQGQAQVNGMSVEAAISYTGLAQGLIAYLSLFGWYELMRTVQTGEISADLLKPIHLFVFWMGRDLGRAVAALLMRCLPILVFYGLFFKLLLPSTPAQWLAILLALFLSWLVSFSWRFLVNLSAFWVPNAVGIGRLAFTLSWFLSGFLMPLRFFPAWFVKLCYLTPFPSQVNTLTEIYLGLTTPQQAIGLLLNQGLWVVILIAASQVVMRKGVSRLVIQGG